MLDATEVWHAHTFDSFEQAGPSVLVLGAGISGLVTACELEALGYRVEVLEGNTRIGGRIHTHRFGPGPGAPFAELGAMRIPAHHHRTLEYIHRTGLDEKLRTFRTLLSEENAFLRTGPGFLRIRDAAGPLGENFRRELEQHLPGHHYDDGTVVFGAWLTAIVDAVAPPDLRAELREDLRRQLLDLVARTDVSAHLRGSAGDRVDLQAVFAAHPWLRTGCSARLNSFLDDILTETGPALLRLEGGMDQLPQRLAARLRGPLRLGHRVTGVEVHGDHVLVRARTGTRSVVRRADFAVCTLPFPAVRRLRLRGLDPDKLSVLAEVDYCPATKVAVHCREPFWWQHGIRGGASFTGGRIRQTYYPPVEGDTGRGAALLASYTIGEEADLMGRLPERRRHRLVLRELAALHPELLAPGMVLDVVSVAWDRAPWAWGGCTTRWGKGPEQCEEEIRRASRPCGRMFFAGEHCSSAPAWIEGAVESALRAVEEVGAYVPGRRPPAVTGRANPAGAL
ncbi:flavin monoamine oxidase [Streptomyces mashuensis]|uniref:Flavin monoamine oxidase n=1 Tax=Streptomyces mashuensis TaxID=33904 RepID=A0A919E992_9ACTN|nr:NAD(P)/FAD-dependent oxidoreductase [Streptomyces mashuensis]GHF26706.1 flavin monoamine oxidase [Streptomyces mashuensis]